MKNINKDYVKDLIINSKKIIGLRQVLKNLLENTIKCVVVSIDSEDFILKTVKEKIEESKLNIEIIRKLTSQEIADICKIDVPTAVVGILS